MRCRGDPRPAVKFEADIVAVGQEGLAGVQPHADMDWAAAQGPLGIGRRGDGFAGAGEGGQEGVPLGIDFDASVGLKCLAQDAMMLCECSGIRVGAHLLQESGRALDVGEKEGDGPHREVGSHSRNIAPTGNPEWRER